MAYVHYPPSPCLKLPVRVGPEGIEPSLPPYQSDDLPLVDGPVSATVVAFLGTKLRKKRLMAWAVPLSLQ